ncbi:MAG: VapC toxin family PIN domain ribonuclease [Actinobacteria bacterium 13_2_20CM_2_71_6]|nr:MAG: VapC toxin family PIN domain ribonuclease [Actinobacteria bacterium 13_2_20CM_2_71_6]
MAAVARYLADTSVFARNRVAEVATVIDPLMTHGLLATCGVLELEVLFSARSSSDHATLSHRRRVALEWLPTEDVDLRRALAIQSELAKRGQHRLAWPDLVIAAVAERHRVTLLHYDADYDLIASVTGQDAEWVVPKGSVS